MVASGEIVATRATQPIRPSSAREAAFLAVRASARGDGFVQDTLQRWLADRSPSAADFNLAKEISIGTTRRYRTLEFLAHHLAGRDSLKLRNKDRAVLLTGLYQCVFMNRVPRYAVVSESVKIASKFCGKYFSSFLNAVLRRVPVDASELLAALPKDDAPDSLGIRLSYPTFLVNSLLDSYGLDTSKAIMEACNEVPSITVRVLNSTVAANLPQGLSLIPHELEECAVAVVDDRDVLPQLVVSRDFYVQNVTPAMLIASLCAHVKSKGERPRRVMDLCASPGGKTIGVYAALGHPDQDEAAAPVELWANDVSEAKLRRLRLNFAKYGMAVRFTRALAQDLTPSTPMSAIDASAPAPAADLERAEENIDQDDDDESAVRTAAVETGERSPLALGRHGEGDEAALGVFDVVIVDAPCSNSGVMHRRPESRWRISSSDALTELTTAQVELIGSAAGLVAPGGRVWYMTCSVLPEENQRVVAVACDRFGLVKDGFESIVLPNRSFADGGYACSLRKPASHTSS